MRNPKRRMPVVIIIILVSYFFVYAGQKHEVANVEILSLSDSARFDSQPLPGKIEIYKIDRLPEIAYMLMVNFPASDVVMSSNWFFPPDSTDTFTHLHYFWQNDTLFQGWMFNPETGAVGDTLIVTKLNNGSSLRRGRRLK